MKIHVLILFAGCLASCCLAAPAVTNDQEAMAFLNMYGYLSDDDMEDGLPTTEEARERAVENFQLFANITITGSMDNDSYAMMNMPRCGMPDMEPGSTLLRKKRYSLGPRWGRKDLKFRIDGRTPDLSTEDVDRIMTESFKLWSDASGLRFEEVNGTAEAEILINFYSQAHGDGSPFDGPRGVLAHAFYPSGGDAHFDEDETWTDGTYSGINLFWVAVHEFGHSLGLGHSQVNGAVMYPYYTGYVPNFSLQPDDVAGIQALYGPNAGDPEEMETLATPYDDCSFEIKIAARTDDGSTYLGNETHVHRIIDSVIQAGYPKPYDQEFPGLPDNLDAGLYYARNGRTYFFKGSQYWRFNNQQLDAGYPRAISRGWYGVPNDVDAAFQWSGNGGLYFIKDQEYYRSGYRYRNLYPRPLSNWQGLPETVDAAFQFDNARTYFFSGTDYYRFNDANSKVDNGYPLSAPEEWLQCDSGQLQQGTLQPMETTEPMGSGSRVNTGSEINALVCTVAALAALVRSLF